MASKEGVSMADETSSTPSSETVVELPWMLISNQIQLLSTQINERFNDQRVRFDDRFGHLSEQIQAVDKRVDGIESRLAFRNSTWLTIILTVLGVILGALLAPQF